MREPSDQVLVLWECVRMYEDDRNRPIPGIIQALEIPFHYLGVFWE